MFDQFLVLINKVKDFDLARDGMSGASELLTFLVGAILVIIILAVIYSLFNRR